MIYEQLRNHCNCIKDGIEDSDIDELVNLISMYTCWQQKPCETFLMGEREEVLELPGCSEECDIFVYEPFYAPFDPYNFAFTMVTQVGIEETSQSVEAKYSEIDRNFKIKLPVPDCKCSDPCGCKPEYKLLVRYYAGYEELPECLLDIFCEALQYIKERKKCDCSDCQTCDNKFEADQVEVLVHDAAKLTDELKVYFIQTLTEQYKRQLSLISLCGRRNDLWGFVV